MLRSALTDSDLCKFDTVYGFCWVLAAEEYSSDSEPIQLSNLIDPKVAHFGEGVGDLRSCRGLFLANSWPEERKQEVKFNLPPEPSWEDDS